jgi:FO synthase
MNALKVGDFLERRPTVEEAYLFTDIRDTSTLFRVASELRDKGHGNIISYSRKIFIPLTKLCRDVCHYCTFSRGPHKNQQSYMQPDEVMKLLREGEKNGCKEALFTLGDKPELRYTRARKELENLGHETTLSYLFETACRVLKETTLLPHINAGVMSAEDLKNLRKVSASQGLMLESVSPRLHKKGGPHYGSPDKNPDVRIKTIMEAGVEKIPFTSGLLIGIGETRIERIEALLVLRDLHEKYGHLQEIIIQNFKAKPGTPMENNSEPGIEETSWTVAVTRILFGPQMNIQSPPNLNAGYLKSLVNSGINDWGGISPLTPDHVNPEAPWPEIIHLAKTMDKYGKVLTERLPVYPEFSLNSKKWFDPKITPALLRSMDQQGYAREDEWAPGESSSPLGYLKSKTIPKSNRTRNEIEQVLENINDSDKIKEEQVTHILNARGFEFDRVCDFANELRKKVSGEEVTYTVNRNINYTNVCYFRCGFCAFSKGKMSENLRGKPYDLKLNEIVSRTREAWDRGATEVCLQGGIHPNYTGDTYLRICEAIHEAVPEIHIHAFSPLEVSQGASTVGLSVPKFLRRLRESGLGTLPGTAAEVLDDEVRNIICPDKLSTKEWLSVMRNSHEAGFRTTATIMFGHVEAPRHVARHLIRIRDLQRETLGFTEFVPLPFVHMEAPIFLKGKSRKGPTYREAVLIHAVARIVLHPFIQNIQTSWVKMGPEGVKACLDAGANDLGGTLMNESITRAAGTVHGQEMLPERMEELIRQTGRIPKQRDTLYRNPDPVQKSKSYGNHQLVTKEFQNFAID